MIGFRQDVKIIYTKFRNLRKFLPPENPRQGMFIADLDAPLERKPTNFQGLIKTLFLTLV